MTAKERAEKLFELDWDESKERFIELTTQAIAVAVEEALEEAAKLSDKYGNFTGLADCAHAAKQIAQAIRRLKEEAKQIVDLMHERDDAKAVLIAKDAEIERLRSLLSKLHSQIHTIGPGVLYTNNQIFHEVLETLTPEGKEG